jgi:AcrR family transcriptional regulator
MATVKGEGRVYGGRTGDERTAGRREALLDAAFAEVAERGWRGLAIDVVCRRAGLNKRYFYESFAGIDTLVAAVTTRVADDAIAATLAVLDPDMPPADYTRAGVGAFVTHLTDDPRRARVLFGAVAADDAASGHRAEAVRRIIATVASRGQDVHPVEDRLRTDLVASFLVGGTSQAVLDWLDGRLAYTHVELIDELAALWTGLGDTAVARDRTV